MGYVYTGSDKFQANWKTPTDVKQWIESELLTGKTLNLCCGDSHIGDVRADIDPERDPDVVCDIHDLPFQEQSFDTVYVDPPFKFYNFHNGMWTKDVWDLCRKRLVLNTPAQWVKIADSNKSWYICEPKNGSSLRSVLQFQVFDRASHGLSDFE